jgi:uncharacterized membrane protein HdeD (DUF308 family)
LSALGLYLAALSVVTGSIALFYVTTETALDLMLGALLVVSGAFLAFFAVRELRRQRDTRRALSYHGEARLGIPTYRRRHLPR